MLALLKQIHLSVRLEILV